MNSVMQFNETTYQSLLVLAENYRIARPPRIRMCLHCLMSVANLNPPPQIQLRTHLQIGSLLIRYTENKQLAQTHLHAAIALSQSTRNSLAYFEAVSLLSTLLCQMSQAEQAKPILREGITASQHNVYWHSRLLLQLASIHHEESDHTATLHLLDVGAELANTYGSDYLKILFLLSKGMVLLVQQKLDDVNLVLSMCGQLIDNIKQATPMQIESHKVYFLTLQVAHLLQGGQVKGVKSSLKQLQQSIQEMSGLPSSACSLLPTESLGQLNELPEVEDMTKKLMSTDGFSWLPRDHMCILVYLVTATHSLLGGYLDKAQKYTERALKLIRKLKVTDSSALLVQMELMFLEHMAQSHLIMCERKAALQKINEGCRLCVTYPQIPVIVRHTTQMHTLLGMYCMSMNFMDDAEKHLQIATKSSLHEEQLMTNLLNLAMVHMHNYQLNNGRISQIKHQELVTILNRINPESANLKSRNLNAASFFVKGMYEFFQSIHGDAKRYLRETLTISDAQDLKRLTACALVLLAHIYLTVGNSEESVNMALPAMQIASKIPDTSVRLWAAALLRDLYRLCGDEEHFSEYKKMYEKLASRLLSEQYTASESSQHELVKWFSEDLPPVKVLNVMETAEECIKDAADSDESCSLNQVWTGQESSTSNPSVSASSSSINAVTSKADIPISQNLTHGLINNVNNTAALLENQSQTFYDSGHNRTLNAHNETVQKYFPSTIQHQQRTTPMQSHHQQLMTVNAMPGPKQLPRPQAQNYHITEPTVPLIDRHLPRSNVMTHNQTVANNMTETMRHRSNLFTPYHLPQQTNDQQKMSRGSTHKPISHDINSLMSTTAAPQKSDLPAEFQNALQQQQFQAFQQMQMGHPSVSGLQNMYNPMDRTGFVHNPMGQVERQQLQSQQVQPQHAAAWGMDPNALFNISNSGYTWR